MDKRPVYVVELLLVNLKYFNCEKKRMESTVKFLALKSSSNRQILWRQRHQRGAKVIKRERESDKKNKKRKTDELDYDSSQSCDTITLEPSEEEKPDIVSQMELVHLPRLERTYATAGTKIDPNQQQ